MKTGNRYFDCFATLGPRQRMEPGEQFTREHVLESMDRCGIDCALVAATLAVRYDSMWANQWLLEQVAPYRERLFPMWTAMPHQMGEFPAPDKFVAMANTAGVRAVRLYPRTQCYSTAPSTLGPLMKALAKAKMPVFIHFDQFSSGEAESASSFACLDLFLKTYRANRIVVLGMGWSDFRYVWPLLENHKNWAMEFSSFQANMAPEVMVKRFGAGRFLFGSDSPSKSPGAARAFFDWTGLSQAQVKKITHGNLCEFLGMQALPEVPKKPADDIVAAEWAGQPLDHIDVLDAHAHINHEGCNSVGTLTQLQSGPSEMKRLFRSIGIRQTAVSSWLSIMAPEPRLGNDVTYAALKAHPDFFIGYACIDPVLMTPQEIEREMALRYGRQGFLGLKPYINTVANFDDPRYEAWYHYGSQHHLFGLFHNAPEAAARIAAKHTGLQVILAHSGRSIGAARKNAEIALTSPNIFCEITLTPVTNGAIELLVQNLGAKRVLFGTDAPMRDPRPQLGWAVHADITREDKVEVLGAAFARILKRCC